MKINFERGLVLFISVVFFSVLFVSFVLADADVYVGIETDGNVNTTTNINNTGDTRVWINGVEWSGLPYYIEENEDFWSRDKGWEARDIEELLDKLTSFMNGEDVELTKDEYNILMYLFAISDNEINSFYQNELTPILDSHKNQIQSNIYEIEAFYRTMEKLHPEIYCESRKEVADMYGLKSFKCGLHSKTCYNGKYYVQQEGGFDFCIYSDDEGRTEKGMDIHVREMEIPNSEENSLTPLLIEFYNQGNETLRPTITGKIMKYEDVLDEFTQEVGEVPVKETKRVIVAWDNEEVEPGEYMARITVSLGKKEILNDIYFDVLEEGSLTNDGEILSIDFGQARTYENLEINVLVKNNENEARIFEISGEVYKNGEKIDSVTSEKRAIDEGDVVPVPINYEVGGLGEYEVRVKLNNQEETMTFSPEPTTPTGRFLTSPPSVKAIIIGIALLLFAGIYRFKFYKKSNKKTTATKVLKNKVNTKISAHLFIAFLFLIGFYLVL